MLLCRNDFSISIRRLFEGSLTTIALALPFAAAAQDGHLRSELAKSYTGAWQLYSTITGLDVAVYADFIACRQAARASSDTSCKPIAIASNDAQTPPVVQPPVVTPPVMNSAFSIDASTLPQGSSGVGYDKVQATSEIAPDSPDIGAFRTPCSYSHMAFDDPIVYPGIPGAAHLHTFFGNTATSATSTAQSIRDSGNSTCLGGTINRTAYWVPTMIDTTTGKPIVPDVAAIYYKQGYALTPSSLIQPLPVGLRMIAGDPRNASAGSPVASFKCIGGPNNSNDQYGSAIPNCDAGAEVYQVIVFPQCWDGRNLDSPDHKSHMSYVVPLQQPPWFTCPATHPVPIPEITFNILYTVQTKDAAKAWRLSSDTYDTSLPGGYSSHGDWFNGWKKDISDTWAVNCVQARKDCHAHLLGDGRMMY
jgi:hypothetical protein